MAKFKVAIGRPCNGYERVEIGTWLFEIATVRYTDKYLDDLIDDIYLIPCEKFPTDTTRNTIISMCQKHQIDMVFMVDHDALPPEGWFKAAFAFLMDHPGTVIGCPYVSGSEQVQVFEWQSPNNDAQKSFALSHIPRESAARRSGIEEVANIGTHCIAYSMSAFAKVSPPYYAYTYNETHTAVTDTEDVFCHRKLYWAGVKIFCHWDYWSRHDKKRLLDKPYIVEKKDIDEVYLSQARACLTSEREKVN